MTDEASRRANARAAEAGERARQAGERAAVLASGAGPSAVDHSAVDLARSAAHQAAFLALLGYRHAADAHRAAARADDVRLLRAESDTRFLGGRTHLLIGMRAVAAARPGTSMRCMHWGLPSLSGPVPPRPRRLRYSAAVGWRAGVRHRRPGAGTGVRCVAVAVLDALDPVRVFGQWAGHPYDAGRLERAVPILCDAALALSRDLA
jgi:hypothetical protein